MSFPFADSTFNPIANPELSTVPPSHLHGAGASWPTLPIQVQETPDHWRIDIPVPGVDPASIRLTTAQHLISLTMASQAPAARTLRIPTFLDDSRMSARYRHGMLELTIPVQETFKPRRVAIDGFENAPAAPPQIVAA